MQPTTYRRLLRPVNMEALFNASPDRIILTDLDFRSPDYARHLRQYIHAQSSDLDFVASCDCGELRHNFYEGETCYSCNSEVRTGILTASGSIPITAWIGTPDNLTIGGRPAIPAYLTTSAYHVLATWLSHRGKTNYIDIILNPELPLPDTLAPVIKDRGFQYFYDNFDRIMHFFMYEHRDKMAYKHLGAVKRYLALYRDRLFTRYLPVPHAALNPVLKRGIGKVDQKTGMVIRPVESIDSSADRLLEAANAISHLNFTASQRRPARRVNVIAARAYKSYLEYVIETMDLKLSKKSSIPRRHIGGLRMGLSCRAVITPPPGAHRYDTLVFPWVIMVNTFRSEIHGHLMRDMGLDPGAAILKQYKALATYDADVDRILQKLIAESPYDGIPVAWNRNPTIKRGGWQTMMLREYLKDPSDYAIRMSATMVKDPNADYDGDAMAAFRYVENDIADAMMPLSPHFRVPNPNAPSTGSNFPLPDNALLAWNAKMGAFREQWPVYSDR